MIVKRSLGDQLPLSVPTAQPFEMHIVGDGPKPQDLWMNVRTLFRNFWGSWKNADRPPVVHMFKDFLEELENIEGLCTNQGIAPKFYHLSYRSLPNRYPHAALVEAKSENAKAYETAERIMMEVVFKQLGDKLITSDIELPSVGTTAWMITSFPFDLLNRFKFSKLELLESHTGKIKPQAKWFSKLNKREDLQHFPFNLFTLQLFGDGSNHFKCPSQKAKNRVIDLGLEKKWHTSTTQTRMREHLGELVDADVRELCLKLARAQW
ncbi:hypothetical protein [Vibrio phage vB_VmeM-Yong XC32]|nr:hypothetical protein [Vibrio phage vB_VmeM-Yong XC31]QAX96361.1 hypothetical protein [Vibrio phage vB_VmeM-Yong XC32]QAX96679.1 hypothetical protein [Vibrio phage vB_VmeM-Yong MS31]QAX96997.1 hypothetical protein [Vibrio phage vB_VmeM-Yong MS32]